MKSKEEEDESIGDAKEVKKKDTYGYERVWHSIETLGRAPAEFVDQGGQFVGPVGHIRMWVHRKFVDWSALDDLIGVWHRPNAGDEKCQTLPDELDREVEECVGSHWTSRPAATFHKAFSFITGSRAEDNQLTKEEG